MGKLMAEFHVKTKIALKNCKEPFDNSTNYQKVVRFADSSLVSELKGYISFIKDRNAKKAKEDYNESLYLRALDEYKSNDINKLNDAIELFSEIAGWKDSKELIGKCQVKIEQIRVQEENERIERERLDAIAKAQAERVAKRNKMIAIITTPIVCAISAFAILWIHVIQPNIKYSDAMALMEAEKYEEAITAFNLLHGYKDSGVKISECNTAIIYNNAIALMNEKKYTEAIFAFEKLDGYKESAEKIEQCYISIYGEEVWYRINSINVGDIYTMGSYEQDNNKSNGKEEIEWIVIDKEDDRLFLCSKYCLEMQKYSDENNIYWRDSFLRQWLKETFYNSAFSQEEKECILETNVSNTYQFNEYVYESNGGPNTKDKVFILSIDEIDKYEVPGCTPTEYANSKRTYSYGNSYWLRSPVTKEGFAATSGFELGKGGFANEDKFIRPAIWIRIK